jgi:hypothetical protein
MITGNKDIDTKIFLEIKDLENISIVFPNICESKEFWRLKIKKDFPLKSKYLYYTKHKFLYKDNPKELYNLLDRNSRFFEGLCYDDINSIENKIKSGQYPRLRGDVALIKNNYFENEEKMIWNGEKLVELDYSIKAQGNVPKEFTFPEFSLEYFSNTISNSIWLSEKTVQEAIENYNEKSQETIISDNYENYIMKIEISLSKKEFREYIKGHPCTDNVFHLSLPQCFKLKIK